MTHRILVTGGAGFIGSALVRVLSESGRSVVVLDDLSGGSLENVPDGVPFVEADVSSPATVQLIAALRPDCIVHAAAQVSVTSSVLDPDRDHAVNVVGTGHVVEGARAAGARRVVFLSSGGAVYGEADGATESTPLNPQSPYGANKMRAEELVRGSGLSHAIARPSNVYGPGQRAGLEGGVVAVFATAATRREPVTVFGDGEQSRDFVFVDDLVMALEAMIGSPSDGTWNVASGTATTVHALLAVFGEALGRILDHSHAPPRTGEVKRSRLDASRAATDLGWRPSVPLVEGIRRTLASAR